MGVITTGHGDMRTSIPAGHHQPWPLLERKDCTLAALAALAALVPVPQKHVEMLVLR